MKRKVFIIMMLTLLSGLFTDVRAQKVSLSTNFVDWAYLGTANIEAGISLSQHFSLAIGGKVNPWEFHTPKGYDMYDKQYTAYAGVRYWPWYVFSGWWLEAKTQYKMFSRTGLWRPALEQGTSIGAGLSFGYTIMLHQNLNLELGAGIWGGRHLEYNLYECPRCMSVRDSGPRNLITADKLSVSLTYIF